LCEAAALGAEHCRRNRYSAGSGTALSAGRLGGAAIDVIDPIPSPDSSLWRTPHLLITPKLASYYPGMQEQTERFVEQQVGRYMQGEPLQHVVDKDTLQNSMGGGIQLELRT
jgi:phosphoglycerate dehydrogenase-like enzyme